MTAETRAKKKAEREKPKKKSASEKRSEMLSECDLIDHLIGDVIDAHDN